MIHAAQSTNACTHGSASLQKRRSTTHCLEHVRHSMYARARSVEPIDASPIQFYSRSSRSGSGSGITYQIRTHHASQPRPCPDLPASEHAYAGIQYCRAAFKQHPTPSGPGPHACNTAGRWHRAAPHRTARLRDAEISGVEIASRHESGTFMHAVDDRWR